MSSTVLTDHRPKFGVPVLPASTVRRARLTPPEPLVAAAEIGRGTVIVITGSGGAGKTTVMAGWATELLAAGNGVGWASLGSDDNNPTSLWETILAAFRNAVAEVDAAGPPDEAAADAIVAIHRLRAPDHPGAEFVGRLTTLLTEVVVPVWLLLDDVHLVRDPACLESLNLLLRWAPTNCHLVLGARSDPTLHLPRLRLQGRVVEIRDGELRFSLAEARAALAGHGIALTDSQVMRLHDLTEGWAAGLGLAALSLRGGRDPDEFMDSFASDGGAMAAYLMDELLGGLTSETREFLLLTCVPERLTPELAEHLSGRDDAGGVLAGLARANSMVSASVGPEPSYRYHALLRGYLNARLKGRGRARFGALHARTATWFADNGLVAEALDHAVMSQDVETAHTMFHRYGVALLLSGRGDTVTRALDQAPPAVRAEPPLQALAAVIAIAAGRLAAADHHIAAAQHPDTVLGRRDDSTITRRGTSAVPLLPTDRLVAVATLLVDRLRGEMDRSRVSRLAHPPATTVHLLPCNLRDLDLLERVSTGLALLSAGEYQQGAERMDETLAFARRAGFDFTVMVCLTQLAGASAAMGDMERMTDSALAALNYAAPRGWSSSPALLYAYLFAAAAAYATCDLTQARRLSDAASAIMTSDRADPGASRGRARIDVDPMEQSMADAVTSYISFAEAHGDLVAQRAVVRSCVVSIEALVENASNELAAYQLVEFHRMAMRTGQFDLGGRAVELTGSFDGLDGDRAVMRGLEAWRRGRDDEARCEVAQVTTGRLVASVVPSTATAWLVESSLARRNAQPAKAHDALLEALDLCDRHHLLRLLVEFSDDTVSALRHGVGRFGQHEPFVERALRAADREGGASPSSSVGRLTSSLTPRELSLLRDLPSMMTIAEIAESRAVSPNTVKTQMRFLFAKLEVGTRRDAVAAGRRVGLI